MSFNRILQLLSLVVFAAIVIISLANRSQPSISTIDSVLWLLDVILFSIMLLFEFWLQARKRVGYINKTYNIRKSSIAVYVSVNLFVYCLFYGILIYGIGLDKTWIMGHILPVFLMSTLLGYCAVLVFRFISSVIDAKDPATK